MSAFGEFQYRVSRWAGRVITRTAAALTLERMPPFVSTSALIMVNDRVLVVIDPIRREPVLPGGHLKWRESPEQAVVREVREETGFHVHPLHLLGVYAGEQFSGEPGIVRIVWKAELAGGALTSSAEGHATWLSAEDIAASETRDAFLVRAWVDERRRQ